MSVKQTIKGEWDRAAYSLGLIGFGTLAPIMGEGIRNLGVPIYFALTLDIILIVAGITLLIAVFKKDHNLRRVGIYTAIIGAAGVAVSLFFIGNPLFLLFSSIALLHVIVLRRLEPPVIDGGKHRALP